MIACYVLLHSCYIDTNLLIRHKYIPSYILLIQSMLLLQFAYTLSNYCSGYRSYLIKFPKHITSSFPAVNKLLQAFG